MPMIQNAIAVQLTALSVISMACARVSMIGAVLKGDTSRTDKGDEEGVQKRDRQEMQRALSLLP